MGGMKDEGCAGNYFVKLSEIKCVTEKRKSGSSELTYVSWSDAWAEVKKLHPDSNYRIYENAEGFPYWSSEYGIDVKVGVTINGIEHIVRLPVMDGANNAMKKEAYEFKTKYDTKRVEAADAFDINKTIQRAFTKAIAMHGIGLYVYRGEDLPIEDAHEKEAKKPKPVERPVDPEQALDESHAKEKASGKKLSDAQMKKLLEVWKDASLPAEVRSQRQELTSLNEVVKAKFDAHSIEELTPTNAERVISLVISRNNTYKK